MKIKYWDEKIKCRLDDLVFGEVFQNPDVPSSFYMVINRRDFIINNSQTSQIPSGYICTINIQNGSFCTFPCDLMIARVHGEFVISQIGDSE